MASRIIDLSNVKPKFFPTQIPDGVYLFKITSVSENQKSKKESLMDVLGLTIIEGEQEGVTLPLYLMQDPGQYDKVIGLLEATGIKCRGNKQFAFDPTAQLLNKVVAARVSLKKSSDRKYAPSSSIDTGVFMSEAQYAEAMEAAGVSRGPSQAPPAAFSDDEDFDTEVDEFEAAVASEDDPTADEFDNEVEY